MCLQLNENFKEETEKFLNSFEILTGYKILKKINNQNFESFYERFPYKLNKIAKSNRFSTDLSEKENTLSEIIYGLHFFTNLKDVKKELFYWNNYSYHEYVIAKFEILPKNLVAVGTFTNYESFVATEAKLVKIVEEK